MMKKFLSLILIFCMICVVFAEGKFVLHTTHSGNIYGNATRINNVELNGNPDAKILVSHVYNPGGVGGTTHDKVVGVWYDGAYWLIYNEDGSTMPPNMHFNVFVGE